MASMSSFTASIISSRAEHSTVPKFQIRIAEVGQLEQTNVRRCGTDECKVGMEEGAGALALAHIALEMT